MSAQAETEWRKGYVGVKEREQGEGNKAVLNTCDHPANSLLILVKKMKQSEEREIKLVTVRKCMSPG